MSKKFLVGALGVATVMSLGVAVLTASAQASFTRNLTVGSSGADVTALQQILASKGFLSVAPTGYFGSLTKAAVTAWQASVGLPSTGYFGSLSRAAIGSGSMSTGSTPGCPAGALFNSMTGAPCSTGMSSVPGCTPGALFSSTTGQPCAGSAPAPTNGNCPAGYTYTTLTPAGFSCVATAQSTIGTPGQIGSVTITAQSSPNNVTAYKGQSYDVAQYKLQATGASDMGIQNLVLYFDYRPWLYASTVTVRDDTGATVGQVNNLSASNFTEITVGSKYSLSIPVTGYVVKAAQTRYLTVNITFLPTSDRASGTINITEAQVRAIDGTGVAVTVDDGSQTRAVSYQGSGAGSIVVTTDSSSPVTGNVQLSTSGTTLNVPLAVYDIKSQSAPSTLRSLSVVLSTNNSKTPNQLFNTVKLTIAGSTYTANSFNANATVGSSASSTAIFNNLSIPLAADQFVPMLISADAAVDTNNALDNTIASTTFAVSGTAGGTSNNPSVEDQSYNTLAVNSATFTSNPLTFTASSVTGGSYSTSYGTQAVINTTGSTTQQFTFTFNLTAGNNPIYVSTSAFTALSTSTNPSGITISSVNFSDSNTNGDGSNYFYLSPGQTKTFTAIYQANGLTTSSGTLQVNSINYGTTTSSLAGASLSSSDIKNSLKAVLFH